MAFEKMAQPRLVHGVARFIESRRLHEKRRDSTNRATLDVAFIFQQLSRSVPLLAAPM
jgi:hypothetical protein